MILLAGTAREWEFEAVETTLKGKEISLPPGASYIDDNGTPRRHIRTRWWDQKASTYKEVFMGSSY